jgi:hypothetical protein
MEGLGRALHGAQDFYAHSNWADQADPTRPIGDTNPPGLNQPGPSAVLDLRSAEPPSVPAELTTGCFVVRDEVPGVGECLLRVTHAALNKDRGLIDPETGKTTDPTTPRGMVEDNFAKAVAGAMVETRRQWTDFQSELTARYGREKGALMFCALTHDDPVNDCRQDRASDSACRRWDCPCRDRHDAGSAPSPTPTQQAQTVMRHSACPRPEPSSCTRTGGRRIPRAPRSPYGRRAADQRRLPAASGQRAVTQSFRIRQTRLRERPRPVPEATPGDRRATTCG